MSSNSLAGIVQLRREGEMDTDEKFSGMLNFFSNLTKLKFTAKAKHFGELGLVVSAGVRSSPQIAVMAPYRSTTTMRHNLNTES